MFPRIHEAPRLALDTETTGLHWWKDSVFGISMSLPEGDDYYWDIRRTPQVVDWLRGELPRYRGRIIGHHMKFDWHMLRELGIELPEDGVDCTMIRAAIIDEHLFEYNLDYLGKKYIGIGKDDSIWQKLADLFGGKASPTVQAVNMHRAPVEVVAPYAKRDTRTTLGLWDWQEVEIAAQGLERVIQLERELLPVIVEMERGGVRVDIEQTEEAILKMSKQVDTLQYQLDNLAGFKINPNPSGSIHQLFQPKKDEDGRWVLRDGTVAEATGAGKASIDADCLRRMKDPCAELILRLRKYIKVRDTFMRGHILGHHHNGVIHANINQTKTEQDVGTITGRLSINDPALQQIHKRDKEIAAIVRSLFRPDDDQEWVCNDWSQMDFRVFAHYVNDQSILDRYAEDPDTDFHKLASDLTGLPRSPRFAGDANAKQINLGLVFGMGQGKLADEMGLPYTWEHQKDNEGRIIKSWMKPGPEAMAVFEKYHGAIPGVQALLKNASSVARSRGHVKTILGRRIRFPRGQFTHKAGGLIFQGSAADALKVKLIEVHRYLKSTDSGARLLLNVHDEFDTSVPPDRADIRAEISRIVTKFDGVDTPIKFRVPVRTQQGVGPNWWIACKD
jgi:DNA polymerase-1